MKRIVVPEEFEVVQPFDLISSHDLITVKPPPMLIEDVLPRGSIMGLTSYPGVGKSWLTLEVLRAVSTGGKFLDHFKAEGGAALFVGSDSSLFDYARQWTRLTNIERAKFTEETHDMTPDEMEKQFGPDWQVGKFASARFLIQSPFMFDDDLSVARLIKTALEFQHGPIEEVVEDTEHFEGMSENEVVDMDRSYGFDVIVFDTLSRLTRADQNDNTAMENVFRNIRKISEVTGAAVIVLHHNSKTNDHNDGTDWRGAMSQIGALDSWIHIAKVKQSKSKLAAHKISVTYKKFRGITPDNFIYQMNVNDPETASLIHTDGGDFGDWNEDGLCQSILILMKEKDMPENGLSIAQITDKLWSQYEDVFTSEAKFKRAIQNRLYTFGLVGEDGPLEKVTRPGFRTVSFREKKKTEVEA